MMLESCHHKIFILFSIKLNEWMHISTVVMLFYFLIGGEYLYNVVMISPV